MPIADSPRVLTLVCLLTNLAFNGRYILAQTIMKKQKCLVLKLLYTEKKLMDIPFPIFDNIK